MHMESSFPDQGSSLYNLEWNSGVPTTGLPGSPYTLLCIKEVIKDRLVAQETLLNILK